MKTLIALSLVVCSISLFVAGSPTANAGSGEGDLGGTFYCDQIKAKKEAASLERSGLQDELISCLYCLQGEVYNCILTPADADGSCTSYWEDYDDANDEYQYWSSKWKNQCERRRIP